MKRVAILATGDEIINGDVFNSNAASIAQALTDHGIQPGQQLAVWDDEIQIEQAIRYLLTQHDALITIGGLGPTSDDRTRFALAKAVDQPLEFDQPSWQRIIDLLTSKGLSIPDNNRQQCYFPQDAKIIPNHHGTASACKIEQHGKIIYMLPGPPKECLPIFTHDVLPALLQTSFVQKITRLSWLVLGMSEGAVAKQLDPLMENSDCQVGYRVDFPYLEIKLQSYHDKVLQTLAPKFHAVLEQNLISHEKQKASSQLVHFLKTSTEKIAVIDHATHGALQTLLTWPETKNAIAFVSDHRPLNADWQITLNGLDDYWQQNSAASRTDLILQINTKNDTFSITHSVPIRNRATLDFACEIFCWELLQNHLTQNT